MAVIFWLVLLLSIAAFTVATSNDTTQDPGERYASYLLPAVLTMVVVFGLGFLLLRIHPLALILGIPVFIIGLVPSWLATQLSRRTTRHTLCWWVAGFSFVRFKQSLFASRCVLILQMCEHLSDEQRLEVLDWLYAQVKDNRKETGTGSFALSILVTLEHQATHSRSLEETHSLDQKIYEQLRILDHAPKHSVSAVVADYVFRRAVTHPAKIYDWDALYALAIVWDTPQKNALAKYVRALSGRIVGVPPLLKRGEYLRLERRAMQFPVIEELAKQAQRYDTYRDVLLARDDMSLLWLSGLIITDRQAFIQRRLHDDAKPRWAERANALNLWDFDNWWREHQAQVRRAGLEMELENNHANGTGTPYQALEEELGRLKYLAKALQQRVATRQYGSVHQEFTAWLPMAISLRRLAQSPELHQAALITLDDYLDDWVLLLWNQAEYYALVLLIARECALAPYHVPHNLAYIFQQVCPTWQMIHPYFLADRPAERVD